MKNVSIKKGTVINSEEFSEMSDLLSSIDLDCKLTDSQYKAIGYFAQLHDVSMHSILGTDSSLRIDQYEQDHFEDIVKSDFDLRTDTKKWIDEEIKSDKQLSKEQRLEELKRNNINIITAGDLMTKKVH